MAVSAQILSPSGAVLGQSVLKHKASVAARAGERYRFIDDNGQLPKGLKIKQVGADALVEWQDASAPDGTASMRIVNFNATPDVAISAPGLSSSSVQGLSYAADSGVISSSAASSAPAYAAPASGSDGLVTAGWLLGGGVALAAVMGGGKGSTPTIPATGADTIAPGAPSIQQAPASNQAPSTFSGTAEPGSTVRVTVGAPGGAGTAVYTVTAAANGAWTINTATTPHTGTYAPIANASTPITATATDAAGNTSAAGSSSFTVDTLAPTVQITDALNGLANSASGSLTYTITLSEAVADFDASDIQISGGTVLAGSFIQTGLNTYSITATPTAGNNAANMVVSVAAGSFHDAAGNGNALDSNTQAYDTLAPTVPTIAALPASNDATPVLTGTAEAGSTVQVTVGGAVFTVVASNGGTWSVDTAATAHTGTFAPNTNGSNAVSVVSTDAAGNATAGNSASFTIDAVAPTIVSMSIANAPADNNYAVGEVIQLHIAFSETVTYAGLGTATMAVNLGMADIDFIYNPLTGYYEHTVLPGELDTNGISTQAGDTIVLNGVTISDALGNTAVLSTNLFLSASLNHTVGSEVHTIVGTAGDDRAGIIWGQTETGNAAGIGTGPTAQSMGGNRFWSGADSVDAGDGNDYIYIYQADAGGSDTIDGGADSDALVYDSFTQSITVNLALGTADLGAYGSQTLQNIEGVIAGSNNDLIVGDNGDNAILDRNGNDTLDGGNGNDRIFDVDRQADTIIGGNGLDTLIYSAIGILRTQSITVALNASASTTDSDGNLIRGIENLELGEGADSARGSDENNKISGGGGNDWLDAGLGQDTIFGGNGNDTVVDGDETSDDLYGGNGIDLIDYSTSQPSPGLAFVFTPVTVNLDTGFTSRGGVLIGFENLIGTALSDSIIGSAGSNFIFAGEGDDYLDGLGGSDTLEGGGGDDTLVSAGVTHRLDGGADYDLASYSTSTAGVSVTLGVDNQLIAGTSSTGDVLIRIEALQGSAFNDTLIGDTNSNQLSGGAGADSLCGGLGSDYIEGGDGADTVFSSAGNLSLGTDAGNVYAGGDDASIDMLDLSARTDGVTFTVISQGNTSNLGDHSGTIAAAPIIIGGQPILAMEDLYSGFERILMTAGNDTFVTHSAAFQGINYTFNPAVWVHGGQGNDTLSGGFSNDTLFGGEGNDLIAAGEGTNQVDGGAGYDTFNSNYFVGPAAIAGHTLTALNTSTLQYTDGSAAQSTTNLISVESFELTLTDDIVDLTGYTQDITINLAGGYDDVVSGSGNDSLYGISTGEVLGGDGNDTIRFYGGGGSYYGEAGNDYLVDESTSNTSGIQTSDIFGGAGNDTFIGAIGSAPSVRYTDVTVGGVTVQLGAGTTGAGGAHGGVQVGVDTFYNIQMVFLTNQNDSAIGNELGNWFVGEAGSDTLLGMGGDDTLWGGNGNTTGNEYIDGGEGNDYLWGSTGSDTLYGGTGADTILGFNGNDWIEGGEGNDSLNSGAGAADTVFGGIGNDSIYVQASSGDSDTVFAGANNDIIDYTQAAFGAAGQRLFGEAGSDVIRISARPMLNDRYDGGAGVDVLQFTGDYAFGPVIDLTQLTNSAAATGVIKGIEVLDFTNTTNATLTLNAASLLNMSDTDNILVITDDAQGNPANTVFVQTVGMNTGPTGWHVYMGGPLPTITMSDGYVFTSGGGPAGVYTAAPAPNSWISATDYSQNSVPGPVHQYQMFQNGTLAQYLLVDVNIMSSGHFSFN